MVQIKPQSRSLGLSVLFETMTRVSLSPIIAFDVYALQMRMNPQKYLNVLQETHERDIASKLGLVCYQEMTEQLSKQLSSCHAQLCLGHHAYIWSKVCLNCTLAGIQAPFIHLNVRAPQTNLKILKKGWCEYCLLWFCFKLLQNRKNM